MNDLKFAVVLGGGFAKNAYQFGFLKAFCEQIPRNNIVAVACASGGALNGYALSADKLDDGEAMWRNFSCSGAMDFLARSWRRDIMSDIVDSLVKPEDKLQIPTVVPLCRVPKIEALYIHLESCNAEELRKIMRAAIAFPVASKYPVKVYKRRYIDGGALDNIPVAAVMKSEADIVMVLHCDPMYLPVPKIYEFGKIVVDIDVTTEDVTLFSSFKVRRKELNKMIDNGYSFGREVCAYLFGDKDASFEDIQRKAYAFLRSDYQRRRKKPALDIVATTLNKIYSYLLLEN